eukprot:TRINITY_DN8079_c0_g4_i2.p1 TRINITY_DN8079_c0_g4~~TRINITY_DN8079_c0_g4_i2.p1  ORF type:complete len:239 (+),score=35.90 TRINITY_DN8079_c0_g4_i2:50-766(+)
MSGDPVEPKIYKEAIVNVDKDVLNEFRAMYPEVEESAARRFLAARGGDVKKAKAMMDTHLAWRKKALPISETAVRKQLDTNMFFVKGVDREGHPLLHFIGPNHVSKNFSIEKTTAMMTYVLEEGIKDMLPGIEKFTVLLFLPSGTETDKTLVQAASKLFGENYPERMYKVWVFPTGMLSRGIWSIIKVFLDPVTAKKVTLLSGGRQPPELKEHVDPTNLLKIFGGEVNFNPCPQLKPK